MDKEELEEYLSDLERLRKEWAAEYSVVQDDFAAQIRGGKWLAEHKRLAADVIIGHATSARGRRLLAHYGLQEMVSYKIQHWTLPVATNLAMEWTHRMQAWLQMWLDEDMRPDFVFTEAHIQSYQEDEHFQEFLTNFAHQGAVSNRVEQLRGPNMTPSAPALGPRKPARGRGAKGRGRGRPGEARGSAD